MREVVKALRALDNYISSKTWILGEVMNDLKNTNEFLKNSTGFQNIYDVLIPIGCTIAIIYFLIAMIQSATEETLTPDVMVRNLIKTLVSVLLIKNGYDILLMACDLGPELASNIVYTDEAFYLSAGTSVRYSFWNTILSFATLIPSLIYFIIVVCVSKCIVWARATEMGIYLCAAPLAFPDIAQNGFNSRGYKIIKKILTLSVQGVVIAMTVVVAQRLSASITDLELHPGIISLGINGFAKSLLIGILMIKMLVSSRSISEDIVGR